MHKKKLTIKETFLLAVQNHQKNNFAKAEKLYKEVLKENPNHADSHYNLGNILQELNQTEKAKSCFEKAIKIKPDYIEAHNNLGNLLHKFGEFKKAINCFEKAIKINFRQAVPHYNLGNAQKELEDYQKAKNCFLKAIEIKSDYIEAHINLGEVFQELGEFKKAINCFKQAIIIDPNSANAYYNLGVVLGKLGEHQNAINYFQKAINLKPDYTRAHSNKLFNLFYLEEVDPKYYLSQAKKFRLSLKSINNELLVKYQFDVNPKKIKVGFVSGDFRQHPVGYFLLDMLKYLKNKNLELTAYSNSKIKDSLSAELKSHFTNWCEITDQNDEKVVNQIRKDGIHILFDLSGHSAKNRLPIFINKPAPIQVTWGGFLNSTGIPEIDYIIGDPYVTPSKDSKYYTEKIFSLGNIYYCFSVPEFEIKITELPAIKNGYITFGSFNNLSKINNKVISLWSRILMTIPKSKIFLKNKELNSLHLKKMIINNFKKNNISSDSIILEGFSPRNELLASYNKVDIALDTFPHSGGTTSFEAIWMGVPVLTKKGFKFISRMTESINHNVNMSDWIANNDNEYVKKAIKFSTNLERLSKIKKNLRQTALESPLFNASLFAEQFKDAVWKMWNDYAERLLPRSLE